MSSSLTPLSKNFLSWGCSKVSQCVEYAWNSAKAVYHVAESTIKFYRSGASAVNAGQYAMHTCPEFNRSRNFNDSVCEASEGKAKPVNSEVYLDTQHLSYGLPQTKRIHTVNDPKLIEDVLHAKRDDVLVASGFKEDLDPLIKKEGDTMLLCPYARHRTLRSPLEKTFSKRTAQNEESLQTMAATATHLILSQLFINNEIAIDHFVYGTLVKQVLQMEISQEDQEAMVQALGKAVYVNTRAEGRRDLEPIIAKILREQLYKEGGGMEAIADAELLTHAEKISTTILMFAAGMHTTINFLKFFTEVLKQTGYNEHIHAEWQRFTEGKEIQTREELISCVANFVQQSDLLHCCFLETMRLYPIIPIIKRVAKKHFMLGDTRVYPGDEIHLHVMAAQRDARHWDNPTQFKPERFVGSLQDGNKPQLLNFGLGSQGCIGKHYAESEAKIMGALFSILLTSKQKNSESPSDKADNYQYADAFSLSIKARDVLDSEHYSLREGAADL